MKPAYCLKTPPSSGLPASIHREAAASANENRAQGRPPADARQITARAVRFVWETMLGANPVTPRDLPDWLPPDLVSFAAAKGSLGPVINALDRWGLSDSLEQKEKDKARLTLARTAMATTAMREELGLILSRCGKKNIDIVLFKGHDLITVCYQDDTIRPTTDADFLVRRHDYPALVKILSDAGYRRNAGPHSGVWSRGGLIIDVHFGFVGDTRNPASAYLPRIESDEIFNGARRREINGVAYLSPDPRHSLIMTALHALTHSYVMDFWFMDAGALLIKNDRASFSRTLADIALRHRLSDVLNYHLWSIREIFGFPGDIPLPTDYRPPRPIRRLIRTAVRRTDYLFFGDILLGFTIDSYRKKFYYFKEMAFPHRDIIAHETGIDSHSITGVYRARLLHLAKSVFRVFFAGRR
ncbi:MAG: nucleotidyltransferase family protein [Deltaproteobacteria bacterium]|nr:nucleotidyltransferase family protein [Candidatus Zymogenaceae bacterium]